MQFARILLFLFAALVSAVAIPNNSPPPTQGGGNTCGTVGGSGACCNQVAQSGGLLGIGLNNLLSCTSVGSGGSCNTATHCCQGGSGGSFITLIGDCNTIL